MSEQLSTQYPQYPLATVCRVLDLPRSSVYAPAYPSPTAEEQEARAHIERIAGAWPTYGYRRVSAQLRREGICMNGKRVRRLMRELGLAGHASQPRCRTTNSDHPYPRYPNLVAELAITQPDAVWVADITYVRLQREFVYSIWRCSWMSTPAPFAAGS